VGDAEQGFARAVDRQDLGGRIERRHAVAPLQPGRDRRAQRLAAVGARVVRQALHVVRQGLLDEGGSGMLRLADAKADGGIVGIRVTPANSWRSFSNG
jgi:hypothetical protein